MKGDEAEVSFQKAKEDAMKAYSVLPNTAAKFECAKLLVCAHLSLFVLKEKTMLDDLSSLRSKLLRVMQRLQDEREVQVSLQESMGVRGRRARLPSTDKNQLAKKLFLLWVQITQFLLQQAIDLSDLTEGLSPCSSKERQSISESVVKLNTKMGTASFSQQTDATALHDCLTPLYSVATIEITQGSQITVLDAMISTSNTNQDAEFKELLAQELDELLETARRQTGSLSPLENTAQKIFENVKKEQSVVSLVDQQIEYILDVENAPTVEYKKFIASLFHEKMPMEGTDELPLEARVKVIFVSIHSPNANHTV